MTKRIQRSVSMFLVCLMALNKAAAEYLQFAKQLANATSEEDGLALLADYMVSAGKQYGITIFTPMASGAGATRDAAIADLAKEYSDFGKDMTSCGMAEGKITFSKDYFEKDYAGTTQYFIIIYFAQ